MLPAIKQANSGQAGQIASFAGSSACSLFNNNQFKRCSKCKQIKLKIMFSKHALSKDGLRPRCKSCTREDDAKYFSSERGRQTKKGYRQTEKYKQTNSRHQIRYRKRYPHKIAAHNALNQQVLSGKIKKPNKLKCSCGKQANEYHHHLGYEPEHWLDVVPVCRICHAYIHRNDVLRNLQKRTG